MKHRSHLLGSAFVVLAALAPAFTLAQSTYYYPSTTSSWSNAGITRAEFVRIVLEERGMRYPGGTRCFTDVGTQSFATYVCAAKQEGLVTGDPTGRFRPNDAISFIEAAAILVRSEGVSLHNDAVWYRPYLDQMNEWRAVPYSVRDIFVKIDRQQALEVIDAVQNRWDDDYEDPYYDECDDYRNSSYYYDDCDDYNDDYYDDRDLRVTVTASDKEADTGDRITFRIRLENLTNREIYGADVMATLDQDLRFISASDSGRDNYDDEVEWDSIRIQPRSTKTLVLTAEIDDNARDGDTLELEVEAGNKTVRTNVRVNDDGGDDDVRISISDTPDPVRAGNEVTYRITFRNMDNRDVTLSPRAYLDSDTTLVSVSDGGEWTGSTVRWSNFDLDEDEERTVTLRARVKSSVRDGDRIRLQVEAGDVEDEEETLVDDNDSNDNDDEDEDVSISMLDTPDPAWPGEQVTYRVTIQNNENHDVRIDARGFLDGNTSFLTASDSGFLESNGQVLWRDLEIRRYESRVILLTLRVREQAPRNGTLWTRVEAGDDERVETTNVR
jgi:uncharacterized repeat protein (TIGR01451 family)